MSGRLLACLVRGQSVKSTRDYLGLLHSIFEFALRHGRVVENLCRTAEKPSAADTDQDIRFLDQAELDALVAAAVNPHGRRRAGTAGRAGRVRDLRDQHGMT